MSRVCAVTPWSFVDGSLSRLLQDFVPTLPSPILRPRVAETADVPPLSAWETETGYFFEFELPGLAEGDVELEILDGVLSIRGRWPATFPEGAKVLRSERPTGEFIRTIRLPGKIDDAEVSAALENGVLRIELPKRPEARPRRISIGSNAPVTA